MNPPAATSDFTSGMTPQSQPVPPPRRRPRAANLAAVPPLPRSAEQDGSPAPQGGSPASLTRRRFRLLKVYATLARVLLSYGRVQAMGRIRGAAWAAARMPDLHRLNARRIERTILEVGGLFVKVGQLLSMLTNFLPEEFRGELEGVQDQVPPRPYEEVAAQIEGELQHPPEELFSRFERHPVAAASLAQVHVAELADGRRLAVKVQHRGIDEIAHLDLATIRRVLKIVQLVLRVKGIDTAFAEIRSMIMEELDFCREAEHLEAIAAGFADEAMIRFPEVVSRLSTRRVLTTSFVDGVKITDLAALEEMGVDREALARRVLQAYCEMVFRRGLYHADPHPGNLLVAEDGSVAFVDFGAVARLSPRMREGIPRFLEGVLRRDTEAILGALRLMGFIPLDRDEEVAERVINYFQRRFLEELTLDSWKLSDIQFDLQTKLETMLDLRRLDVSMRDLTASFEVPREWILLQRTLVLLLGLSSHLAPDMNPMSTIRPYAQELVLGRKKDWAGMAVTAVKDLALAVFTLPATAERVLTKADRGRLEVRVRGLERGVERLYALGHQLLYGLFAVAGALVAYDASGAGRQGVATAAGWVAAVSAALLAASAISSRWRRR